MGTEVRPVRFQSGLLEELEARLVRDGGDLSHFVNHAIDVALHGAAAPLRLVPEPVTAADLDAGSQAYRLALLERDGRRARELVQALVDRGAHIIDVYTSVLAPALEEIGELWSLDQITIADEHYATDQTTQLLGELAPDHRVEPTRGRLAVVAATPGELHALGARMVADMLERTGWEVIGLGADAPAGALVDLVATEVPDLVAISTTTVGRLPGVEEVVGLLHRQRPRPLIAVGGGLFRGPIVELARAWGADVVTTDIRVLLDTLDDRFPPAGGALR